MTKRPLETAVTALIALVLLAVPAKAGSIIPSGQAIDFSSTTFPGGINHPGGSLSFTQGIGNALSVLNAPMEQLIGGHGPSPTGRYGIQGGFLDFLTGGCYSGCTKIVNGQQGPNFSNGGSLVISGAIPSLGISSSTDLIKGTFFNFNKNVPATHATLHTNGNGGLFGYLDITFIDPTLVTALHLLGGTGAGHLTEMFFKLNFTTSSSTWNGSIKSSDLIIVPVPEPTALILMGSALLMGAGLLRRKRIA